MIKKVFVWFGAGLLVMGGLACGDSGPSEAFCAAQQEFSAAGQELAAVQNAQHVEAVRSALVKMRDKAPEEIKDDVESFLATLDKAVEADDPSLLQSQENAAVADRIDAVGGECSQ